MSKMCGHIIEFISFFSSDEPSFGVFQDDRRKNVKSSEYSELIKSDISGLLIYSSPIGLLVHSAEQSSILKMYMDDARITHFADKPSLD